MPGIMTPGSCNPARQRAISKMLSNQFIVGMNEEDQMMVYHLNKKMGSQVYAQVAGIKGSFNLKSVREEGLNQYDADNDFFMMNSE